MSWKTKRLCAVVTAAVSLAVAAPAGSANAVIGPCQVRSLAGIHEWYQEVLVTGESAPTGAIDVRLTCGIVRDGVTVWSKTDALVGPVAALAEHASVHAGFIYPCYRLSVMYIEHTTYTNTCP